MDLPGKTEVPDRAPGHGVKGQILVTGGTGTLGRLVVAALRAAGCQVRVVSRHTQEASDGGVDYVVGDLATGEGVAAAVDGVHTIVHCAGSAKGDQTKAGNLVSAAQRSGTSHLVYISVVGADRVPIRSRVDRAMFGYFGAKFAAERIVAESGLPFTTLRATQFHDLVFSTAQQLTRLPVVPAPTGVRFQPIEVAEVAARLTDLALGTPRGLVPEMGGPQIYLLSDLLRGYLRATGRRRAVVSLRQPGAAAAAFRDGANLAPSQAVGHRTWEDFLAQRVGT